MSIFPSSPNVGDQFSGYEWDGTAWAVIGVDLNQDYALSSELTAALADTTGVHGIADTSALATETYVTNALSGFETLPNQTNNGGKYLTTDGTNASWANVSVGNIDGGFANSVYGGVTAIDGGGVT